jgi:hypothetical protein
LRNIRPREKITNNRERKRRKHYKQVQGGKEEKERGKLKIIKEERIDRKAATLSKLVSASSNIVAQYAEFKSKIDDCLLNSTVSVNSRFD